MSLEYVTEKRDFVRLHTDIPIRYKFLSKTIDIGEEVHEGVTTNLNASGLLLVGRVPSISWIPALLMEEIIIGLNLLLPSLEVPIKALSKESWIESFPRGTDRCALGLSFNEISKPQQDEILKYIIKAQISK